MVPMVSRNYNDHKLHRRTALWAFSGENVGMQIQLNGESRQTRSDTTISTLLAAEGLAGQRVAVEVNGSIVPRAQHPLHLLHDGDRIEIVHALGGG